MRCTTYLALLLAYQFSYGMFGAYSVAKRAMKEDVGLGEDVFGTCDRI